jgi:hypothetical protein
MCSVLDIYMCISVLWIISPPAPRSPFDLALRFGVECRVPSCLLLSLAHGYLLQQYNEVFRSNPMAKPSR